jgi:hypothetical protein
VTITPVSFVADFAEFANASDYPTSAITYWANLGGMLLSTDRFGPGAATASAPPTTLYDIALELFVAHNLVIEKQAKDSAANNAAPGVSEGPVSSKSVAGVSVSYDTGAALDPNAGHWNLTVYGTRLWELFQKFGAGPIQITGAPAPQIPGFGVPWFGPVVDQGWSW